MGERISEALARALTAMLIAGFATFFALGGLGFLAAAAYMALTSVMSPAAAGAVVGVGGLIVAALLVLSLRSLARAPQRTGEARDRADGDMGVDAAARLGEDLATAIRSNRKTAAGAAFAAGVILGVSPRARHAVRDLLMPKR
ncbi:hypothetical protein KBTX_00816 [wastewater metagenome]|uniref:Phage holin family protein n=2 Tax=unclassified sequences TaxID=12908 RepID=A0A5B8R974_9ZZZZ|nr:MULTISPECIES: phage holin family protein [Arhodomonas]MCS4505948.1 phage holin family protein [Arhodomonas aquaeolei]QEA04508.1 hypothetical protein KBTEX_00816 [uncultured organism]